MRLRKGIDALSIPRKQVFYSPHGQDMSWAEMISTEVEERGNYRKKEIKAWEKKYSIAPSDRVIWVTPSMQTVLTYIAKAEDREEILNLDDSETTEYIIQNRLQPPQEYSDDEGFIIPESNDGNNGYLMGLRPQVRYSSLGEELPKLRVLLERLNRERIAKPDMADVLTEAIKKIEERIKIIEQELRKEDNGSPRIPGMRDSGLERERQTNVQRPKEEGNIREYGERNSPGNERRGDLSIEDRPMEGGRGRGDSTPPLSKTLGIDENYRIIDEDILDVKKWNATEKINNNINAIVLAKKIIADRRLATAEEKQILIKYVGWGGLSQVFAFWEDKYIDLRKQISSILTKEEYEAARSSTINV